MDTDFRIPMTVEQKAILDEALAGEPGGKAEWARTILLAAATRKLARSGKDKPGRR